MGFALIFSLYWMSSNLCAKETQVRGDADSPNNVSVTLDKLEKIWSFQAESVSRALALDKEQEEKLVESYILSRNTFRFAMESLVKNSRENEVQTPLNQSREFLKMMQNNTLSETWKEFLDKQNSGFALLTLGSFQKHWDFFGAIIHKYKLSEKDNVEAFDHLLEFVLSYETLLLENKKLYGSKVDGLPMEKVEKFKDKLDAGLKAILSDAQFAQWETQT